MEHQKLLHQFLKKKVKNLLVTSLFLTIPIAETPFVQYIVQSRHLYFFCFSFFLHRVGEPLDHSPKRKKTKYKKGKENFDQSIAATKQRHL